MAPVPQTSIPYLPALDGLRALCVLGVVLNHTPGGPAWILGYLGVDVFFVLSGFLITRLLISERARNGFVSLKGFYTRRFFRIVPVYLFTIALYGAAVAVSHSPLKLAQYKRALPWLVSFLPEYRPLSTGNIMGHAWTLGIEEKFYLLWPLLLIALYPFLSRSALWLGAIATAILFLPSPYARSYDGLLIGAVLAIVLSKNAHWRLDQRLANIPTLLPCLAIAAAYALTLYDSRLILAFSLSVALFIGFLVLKPGKIAALLSTPAMVFTGKRTYSMYLIHVLVVDTLLRFGSPNIVVTASLSYLISLLVASAMYLAIERPCITFAKKHQPAALTPAPRA